MASADAAPLRPRQGMPRLRSRRIVERDDLAIGEWSLTAAAWTDRHQHVEVNYVLEGELHVTVDGTTTVTPAGGAVEVPAGTRARYAAPRYARMLFVYGPSTDGHAATDTAYEELTGEP
jgi:quercetin dioxygenase-like cupin family protein